MSNKPQPLTTEDFMVPARDPGIEIFVRNKRPADMRAFRPERTVLFVHERHLSRAHHLRSADRRPLVDGSHRRARLRRLSARSARLRQIHAPAGNGAKSRCQSADRAHRDRGQGYRRRGRFHSCPPRHSAARSARLVVGHVLDADLHHRASRQSCAACALCADLDRPDRPACARQFRPHAGLPHGDARAGKRALA